MTANRKWEIWIGAYAPPEEVSITRLELDGETGEWAKTSEYGGTSNPSFLALNRAGTVLYTVSESEETEGQPGGRMIAYPIDEESRKLQDGWERLTHSAGPCHVSLDPDERWLAVANYNGSSVTLYPLEAGGKPGDAMVRLRHSGSGPNPERQEKPHPHSAVFDPLGGRFLYVPDLGIDRIVVYENVESGTDWTGVGAAVLSPGDGPRHFAFHPDGRSAYLVNELSSSVTRFLHPEAGVLERQETVSTLPGHFQGGNTCAEIAVSPDGRFVYASNRGHDSIAVFRLDEESGALQPAGHVSTRGRTPRNFAITPDGRWLLAANQDTDNIALFRVDAATGLPIYAGTEIPARKPVCVRINPGLR
ncbi:lactonase family protein [Cohnella sp. CFH 77786]|uniref:lactonase family protein n=1 Tax=Cohnella sp. CFH 77786 TaxID=2662265 RepID=UPI001C608C74|nr:lactonase family protein [Cohnella sp. CFH 77786]